MSSHALDNVTRISHDTVYSHIQAYLRNRGARSKNTQRGYEYDIRQFYKFMRNKDIEDLTPEDLIFNNSEVESYQNYLYHDYVQTKGRNKGKKYNNTTINRKMDAIVALYRALQKKGFDVNPEIMKVDPLPDDSTQIGHLNVDEIDMMLAISKDKELNAFIMLALRTSLRKEAIRSLHESQIQPHPDKKEMYLISTIDKGKKAFVEIHQVMYDVLMEIKKDDGIFFSTPMSTLDYRFRSLCKRIGIDERRNVSVHSLKKAGVKYVKEFTNDLHAAQKQAGHASPSTTEKYYLQNPRNLAGSILDIKIDDNIFDQLTHEELLELVKSLNGGTKHMLKIKASEIVESRNKVKK